MVAPAVCTIFQPGRLAFLEAPVRGLFSTPLSRSALQGRPDRTPYYETPEGTQGYAPVFAPGRQRSVGLAVILRIPRRIKVEAAFSLKFLFTPEVFNSSGWVAYGCELLARAISRIVFVALIASGVAGCSDAKRLGDSSVSNPFASRYEAANSA
jgi:hypothetical protein